MGARCAEGIATPRSASQRRRELFFPMQRGASHRRRASIADAQHAENWLLRGQRLADHAREGDGASAAVAGGHVRA